MVWAPYCECRQDTDSHTAGIQPNPKVSTSHNLRTEYVPPVSLWALFYSGHWSQTSYFVQANKGYSSPCSEQTGSLGSNAYSVWVFNWTKNIWHGNANALSCLPAGPDTSFDEEEEKVDVDTVCIISTISFFSISWTQVCSLRNLAKILLSPVSCDTLGKEGHQKGNWEETWY